MMNERSGKVALVTGSGRRRLGLVVAQRLAELGYAVGIHYHRSAEPAQQTVQEMRSTGAACEAFRADVSQEEEVEQLFQNVLDRFGRLDVLVTTSAIWEPTPLEGVTVEEVLCTFRVNTLGTFLCARRGGLQMVRQPEGGAIVTFGDWATRRPYSNYSAYFLSKGTIATLTRTLAVELAQRNPKVRVNCIEPGPVMFPSDSSPGEQQEMIDSTLVKQANCPESIAHAVQFLIENEFVTGICLPVDGGRSIFAGESRRNRPI